MISKQTLYLSEDRSEVVAEGDPKAKFLLVKAGHEIADPLLEKHEGAAEMAAKESKAKQPASEQKGPAPQNREQAMPKRRTRAK